MGCGVERTEFDLQQTLTYANYLRSKMEQDLGEQHLKTYQEYSHIPIHFASRWRVFPDIYIRVVDPNTKQEISLDENNPATYKRFIFNPYTDTYKIVTEEYIEAMQQEVERIVQEKRIAPVKGIRPPVYRGGLNGRT